MKPFKLAYKYLYTFDRGMENGATAAALDMKEDPETVAIKAGNYAKREREAFVAGYELGKQYVPEWRESGNLTAMAVRTGDVVPKNFKRSFSRDTLSHYWEEV